MIIKKILWSWRLLLYSLIYKNVSFPGYIGKPLLIMGLSRTTIGKRFRLLPGARIEIYKKGIMKIGENTSIGQNFHAISQGNLHIGKNVLISGNVLVTNVDHDYAKLDTPVIEQPTLVKDTFIGDNCFIGYGVVIQAGTRLGNNCIVGANSVVKGTFPDQCVLVGAPARIVKKYNNETGDWVSV